MVELAAGLMEEHVDAVDVDSEDEIDRQDRSEFVVKLLFLLVATNGLNCIGLHSGRMYSVHSVKEMNESACR